MDNSDNGGAEPHKAFAKDVPKMINLDEKVQKKSTNSKDSIVKTARKKVPPLSPDSNEPELDTTESNSDDRKDKSAPRKQLKKKPVAFEKIVESELIVGPDDVVIGPSYVLTEIAKSMDKEAREFELKKKKSVRKKYIG